MNIEKNSGKELEQTVHLIQETLLATDPSLKGGHFTIELNKRVNIGGVHQEIDVYAVTNPGTDYESIVLFECKDWKDPVSTAVLMSLKAKVDFLGATRGILVAPELSRDAEALLSQYKNLGYRRCSREGIKGMALHLLHVVHDLAGLQITVTPWSPASPFPQNLPEHLFRWGDRISVLESLIKECVDNMVLQDQNRRSAMYSWEGVHWREFRKCMTFPPKEFWLCEVDVARIEIMACFFMKVTHNSPRYRCSIDGDGHVARFELTSGAAQKLEVNVVLIDKKKPEP